MLYIALVFSEPRATKYAPCGALSIVSGGGERNIDRPLILAVLCDRSFQNLILGILGCRTGKQQGENGWEMSALPSRHLSGLREQLKAGELKNRQTSFDDNANHCALSCVRVEREWWKGRRRCHVEVARESRGS